jgi:hypothetical protein
MTNLNYTQDTPGLKRKLNKDGTFRFYWEARSDLAKRGYRPTSVRLHYPDSDDGRLQLAARCRILQAEMLAWAANEGEFPKRGYDGTMESLGRCFLTDADSPHQSTKWNTQRLREQCIKIITSTVGKRNVGDLLGPDFKRWYKNWGAPAVEGGRARPYRAKHCMDTSRAMIAYGVTLGHADCRSADHILDKMRFASPAARESKMTIEQVAAIRTTAHRMGLGSIALATAYQFELAMRQKDVIGEWEPCDGADGGIVHKGRRWVNGLLWSHIDSNLILSKRHVKTRALVEHDLKLCPMVLEEIALIPPERRVGPVIISESTGEPFKHRTFTQTWRRVADRAGLPPDIWNMDARAGAVSEAYAAGAEEQEVMKLAGHKNRQTSSRYNRETLEQTRAVQRLRLAKRNGNKG